MPEPAPPPGGPARSVPEDASTRRVAGLTRPAVTVHHGGHSAAFPLHPSLERALLFMFEYTLPVHDFTIQPAQLASVPAAGHDHEPVTNDPHNPTQITLYASGPDAALRIASRHLTHLHARRAYNDPAAVTRTAPDVVYAETRARAETLTPDQREEESLHAIHSEDDGLRMDALTDVMREHGELPS